MRAKHPEVFTVSAADLDAWHRHEAWRCESTKNWSNAVMHLSALLETHPDSGDFLPRRAAAYVAMAGSLSSVAAGVSPGGTGVRSFTTPELFNASKQSSHNPGGKMPPSTAGGTPAATELLERALGDYNRTLAWVERYPANVKESRKPFVEKRREVYLKLGRVADAAADERELKSNAK